MPSYSKQEIKSQISNFYSFLNDLLLENQKIQIDLNDLSKLQKIKTLLN